MNRIRKMRENLEKTQEELANELNIPRQSLSIWENDENLNLDGVCRLADYFGGAVDYLIGRSDIPGYDEKAIKKYVKENFDKISDLLDTIK